MPKLTHPDAPGLEIEPKVEHADEYRSQGWGDADEKPAATPKK